MPGASNLHIPGEIENSPPRRRGRSEILISQRFKHWAVTHFFDGSKASPCFRGKTFSGMTLRY